MRGKAKRGAYEEAAYLLDYEKQRLHTCARSFKDLAEIVSSIKAMAEEEEANQISHSRQHILLDKQKSENREYLVGQLGEMADLIGQVVDKKVQAHKYPASRAKKIKKLFAEEGMMISDIYRMEEEDGKNYVGVRIRNKKKETRTTEELAGYLSVILDRHLRVTESSPFFITDEEQTVYLEDLAPLQVLTGYAKATKESEKISGDNHTFFETAKGEFVAVLSDGMGSGEKACKDSEIVIEMAEKFLQTGINLQKTVQMMNHSIIAGGGEDNMSTLDLCGVDLFEKEATFIKIGSTYSYLKRQEHVDKISSVTLPLGTFFHLDIHQEKRKIQDGDYIILLSDGITDCLMQENKEEEIRECISTMPWVRPAEIAGQIMNEVLQISKGKIRDDMTVLVMGFWENAYED